MRCRSCNVDLPEFYTVCPLCGGRTSDDEPLIQGIRTAEYPKVKTEKYKRNPFPIFLGVWFVLSLLFVILNKAGVVSELIAAAVFCAVPCIWTVIVRPLAVEQLYLGNYIVMNFYPFALICAVISYFTNVTTEQRIADFAGRYLPLSCIAVLLALTVVIFLDGKNKKRAAAYPVLFGVPAVIIAAVLAVTEKAVPISWCIVVALCGAILLFLFAAEPQATKDELAAKFSVQKSLKKYK